MSSCNCDAGDKLIFSCSGAADVGALADNVARNLTKKGEGEMSCLAGIGGRVSGIIKKAEKSRMILAIEGCSVGCARKSLEECDIKDFKHIQLGDVGMVKEKTELTDDNIKIVVEKCIVLLQGGCL